MLCYSLQKTYKTDRKQESNSVHSAQTFSWVSSGTNCEYFGGEDNDGSARVTTSHKLSFSPGLALGVRREGGQGLWPHGGEERLMIVTMREESMSLVIGK